ncbi:MAG: ferrous iron transport protein B [Paraprevotella sp.]|nr:ferrous iron transport protein B [Paraprevotella sp.]
MRLSELKTGEKGIIVKVLGHGGFRKRIIEMGFIRGKIVTVMLNAPLQDPVKYRIMGYEVSLRHSEAEMIEIVSTDEAKKIEEEERQKLGLTSVSENVSNSDGDVLLHKAALEKSHTINVALVGNPNCGKTSLFNFVSGAHERVGNYSGVTVDAKEGHAEYKGYIFNIVDLPGTYSLSAYSPEELYVRKQITESTPDVIINVIDASNLERNLYLTTQLVDMNLKIVGALNMFDEFEARGDKLDNDKLGELFGIPFVPTVFRSGRGINELFDMVINVYEGIKDPLKNNIRHIHLNHGKYIERAIDEVKAEIQKNEQIRHKYSTRFLAIKLLEKDQKIENVAKQLPNKDDIFKVRDKAIDYILKETKEDSETAIMNAKYGIIHGALQEAGSEEGKKTDTYQMTHVLDAIITNRYFGFPLFFIFLYIMFEVTFTLGQYPMDWIEAGVEAISNIMSSLLPVGPLRDMIVDGAIAGVGAVIVFLPQILILYTFISFMEDSGYMARAAFIMDKVMHKMGLHGKSFIPLIMGFGCNVPAVMATRTIENRRSRLITILVLPFMSCSARLPIYIMIIGTFFAVKYQSLIMITLYVTGIILAVIMSRIFSKWLIKGDDTPFVMELPPYRFPTLKAITRHTWEKGKQYLKKMGGIILVASLIVWALGYFPHDNNLDRQTQQEHSYIGQIGKVVEPIFRPQGFDWKLDVSLMAGIGAKEIVASTMGVLYADDESVADDNEADSEKYNKLYVKMTNDGITPLIAFSYLLFVLIYFPCIATIAAIKSETGSWKWAMFTALYTTLLAWIVSAVFYQTGSLFF